MKGSKKRDMFKGFCFDNKGYHTPVVSLNTIEEVIRYCKLQGSLQHEVRITDSLEEGTVMQVIESVFTWPEQLKGIHISEI